MLRRSLLAFGILLLGQGIYAQTMPPAPVESDAPSPASADPMNDPVPPIDPVPTVDPNPPDNSVPPVISRPQAFPISLGSGIGGAYGAFGGGTPGAPGTYGAMGGQGGQGMFVPRANFASIWYPDQPVRGQNTDLGSEREEFSLSLPFWHNVTDTVTFNTNVRSVLYQTNAILPTSGTPFPSTLWNIGLGVNYSHMFQNGWVGTAMFNVGSSSDQPFDRLRDDNVSIGGFVRIPSGERNSWMVGAMYSPMSELPFPIPIASYLWQPNNNFSMNVGLPFSMRWQALRDLMLNFSYVPIRTVHTRITYRVANGLGIYTGFDWSNESYFLADRTDDQERFFYYEKRLVLGVRYNFASWAALDFMGGYAFDRIFFTGTQWVDNMHDRVDVGNTPFLALRFQVRF